MSQLPDSVQSTPPAEGEVGEFIVQLKSYAEYGTPIRLIPFVVDRAATLLQQQEAEINRLRARQAPVPDADEQPNDEEETQYDRDMADYDRNPALTAEQRNSWTRA